MAITDTATHALLIDGEVFATARELAAGTVWINEHLATHGGVKGSGFGKDMSMHALEEYTAVCHAVSPR